MPKTKARGAGAREREWTGGAEARVVGSSYLDGAFAQAWRYIAVQQRPVCLVKDASCMRKHVALERGGVFVSYRSRIFPLVLSLLAP